MAPTMLYIGLYAIGASSRVGMSMFRFQLCQRLHSMNLTAHYQNTSAKSRPSQPMTSPLRVAYFSRYFLQYSTNTTPSGRTDTADEPSQASIQTEDHWQYSIKISISRFIDINRSELAIIFGYFGSVRWCYFVLTISNGLIHRKPLFPLLLAGRVGF